MVIFLLIICCACAFFAFKAYRLDERRNFAAWVSACAVLVIVALAFALEPTSPSRGQQVTTQAVGDDDTPAPNATQTDGPAHPNPTPAINAAQQRAKIRSLLERGERLLDDATSVVNVTPSNRTAAATLTGGPDGHFYDADRAWKANLDAMNTPGKLDDNAASVALLTMLSGDQAMFVAVQDALASCNEHDARLKLREAREDYRESKLVLGGANPDSFNGFDATSKLDNASQCAE